MHFLLLGGTGQVGTEFCARPLPPEVQLVAPDRLALDLSNPNAIAQIIASKPWSVVINAAGYTDVDRAESEEPAAFAINADAPKWIATETARQGIPLIHISTDYVFDGRKGASYTEEDEPSPLNAYGRSKLSGEHGIRAGNRRHLIVRTSWVYSPYRKNFVRTILKLAAKCERLTIVADQRGCPTAACDVAQVCLDLAVRCALEPDRVPYGTYHFAGAGEASRFEFAGTIVDLAADRLGQKPSVHPIRTADYSTAALRPTDSRLNCSAIISAFGISPQPWQKSLADTIDRLLTNKDMP